MKKTIMDCSYIPEDVMREILRRVPVKSLLQFQCVSKSWHTLIRSSNFGSEHSIFSSGRPSSDSESMLVLDADEFWHLSGDNLETRKRLGYFPVKFALQLYGCCDGIVCVGFRPSYLYLTPKETYFLWNPATSEYKNLPPPCIVHSFGSLLADYSVGFGFDPKNNDYKVVRMDSHLKRAEVYSMRTNSWREIQPVVGALVTDHNRLDRDRCVNGVLFWECSDDHRKSSILVFDMGEEKFKVIDVPVAGNLYGFKFNESSIAVLDPWKSSHIDVWVMDVEFKNMGTSSWVKHFTISYPRASSFAPLGFTSTGELLYFTYTSDCQLASYCPIDRRVMSLCGGDVQRMKQFVCYRESLAPLEGENELKVNVDYNKEMYGGSDDVHEFSTSVFESVAESEDVEVNEDVEDIGDELPS